MSNYINNLNTYANMTAYNADQTKDYPNVSYIVNTDEVIYSNSNSVVYATFEVTSPTKIPVTYNPAFGKIELNGQEIQLVETYKYDFEEAGTYTLKYTLSSQTTIPQELFGWCYEMVNISKLPSTITSIGEKAFLGCNFVNFIIPSGVTSIGKNAFDNCRSLTSVVIPSGVTSILGGTFYQCSGLTSVTIPNGVTSIDESAFHQCSSLTTVKIPSSVTFIGHTAFGYCTGLTGITIEATTPPTLDGNVFTNTNDCPIYVPADLVNTYKAAPNWSYYYSNRIQAIPTT